MKNYRLLTAVLLTAILFSCGSNEEEKELNETPVESSSTPEEPTEVIKKKVEKPKDTHVKITHTEDQLITRIRQLPEVKTLSEKIERESKGKRHLAARISSHPSDDQEYYGVSVSEDNGESLATYFEFRIYPDQSIYYYDAVEDQELTLKEWRARKK